MRTLLEEKLGKSCGEITDEDLIQIQELNSITSRHVSTRELWPGDLTGLSSLKKLSIYQLSFTRAGSTSHSFWFEGVTSLDQLILGFGLNQNTQSHLSTPLTSEHFRGLERVSTLKLHTLHGHFVKDIPLDQGALEHLIVGELIFSTERTFQALESTPGPIRVADNPLMVSLPPDYFQRVGLVTRAHHPLIIEVKGFFSSVEAFHDLELQSLSFGELSVLALNRLLMQPQVAHSLTVRRVRSDDPVPATIGQHPSLPLQSEVPLSGIQQITLLDVAFKHWTLGSLPGVRRVSITFRDHRFNTTNHSKPAFTLSGNSAIQISSLEELSIHNGAPVLSFHRPFPNLKKVHLENSPRSDPFLPYDLQGLSAETAPHLENLFIKGYSGPFQSKPWRHLQSLYVEGSYLDLSSTLLTDLPSLSSLTLITENKTRWRPSSVFPKLTRLKLRTGHSTQRSDDVRDTGDTLSGIGEWGLSTEMLQASRDSKLKDFIFTNFDHHFPALFHFDDHSPESPLAQAWKEQVFQPKEAAFKSALEEIFGTSDPNTLDLRLYENLWVQTFSTDPNDSHRLLINPLGALEQQKSLIKNNILPSLKSALEAYTQSQERTEGPFRRSAGPQNPSQHQVSQTSRLISFFRDTAPGRDLAVILIQNLVKLATIEYFHARNHQPQQVQTSRRPSQLTAAGSLAVLGTEIALLATDLLSSSPAVVLAALVPVGLHALYRRARSVATIQASEQRDTERLGLILAEILLNNEAEISANPDLAPYEISDIQKILCDVALRHSE